jgi:hypothetical protein
MQNKTYSCNRKWGGPLKKKRFLQTSEKRHVEMDYKINSSVSEGEELEGSWREWLRNYGYLWEFILDVRENKTAYWLW